VADEKRKSWGIQTRGRKEKKTREKLGCAKFFLQIESIFSNPTPFFFLSRQDQSRVRWLAGISCCDRALPEKRHARQGCP